MELLICAPRCAEGGFPERLRLEFSYKFEVLRMCRHGKVLLALASCHHLFDLSLAQQSSHSSSYALYSEARFLRFGSLLTSAVSPRHHTLFSTIATTILSFAVHVFTLVATLVAGQGVTSAIAPEASPPASCLALHPGTFEIRVPCNLKPSSYRQP